MKQFLIFNFMIFLSSPRMLLLVMNIIFIYHETFCSFIIHIFMAKTEEAQIIDSLSFSCGGRSYSSTFSHNYCIIYCKQLKLLQQYDNNIIMSSSLPKIKTPINNSEIEVEKNLKFKKLKLSTSESTEEIRQRFKSVKLSRLNSLQKYATLQQQREYKQQKIHMNLIQRKLQAGTYDQTKQAGKDLNTLKQKTDFYKTQSALKLLEIEKIKKQTEQLKNEMKNQINVKDKVDQQIKKLIAKYDSQKHKNEAILLEKSCCQHMRKVRQSINLTMNNKIMILSSYLTKLKASIRQISNYARDCETNMKNLILQSKKTNEELFKQQRNREDKLEEKQNIVNKKTQQQKKRELKSKQFRQSLELGDQQLEKQQFNASYVDIIANLFIRRFSLISFQQLQQRYQLMENLYQQITSYQKFNAKQPKGMIERFSQLPKQTNQYQLKIKKLQKQLLKIQAKNLQMSQYYNKSKLIRQISVVPESNQKADLNKQSEYLKIANENIVKMSEILRWNQKQSNNFEIEIERSLDWKSASSNIIKILREVCRQRKQLNL